MNPLRIAVVGCGAISSLAHVPALSRHTSVSDSLVFVDHSVARARELADQVGSTRTETDHRSVLEHVDGAIVAVPPRYHADIARDFLDRGVPVLIEKPLAMSGKEALALVEAARTTATPIAVNNQRRLIPGLRKVKELISSGQLGSLRRIEIYDGAPFGWPLASGGLFGSAAEGRGVLQDIGAHVLDTLCWWLGGPAQVTAYRDDSFGGTEGVARVEFEFEGCTGVVQLSWLSDLSNDFLVQGEKLHLHGALKAWDHITQVNPRGGRTRNLKLDREFPHPQAVRNRIVDNFLGVIQGTEEPVVPGEQVIPSLQMIDSCYEGRQRFDMPWMATGDLAYAL